MDSKLIQRHCAFCLDPIESLNVKTCGGCKKRAYCSRGCQVEDWSPKKSGQGHKNWCNIDCGEEDIDWKVCPIPGKLLGILALRNIPPRYRIIVETCVELTHPKVMDLMPEGGTLDEKWKLNILGCGANDDISDALCLRISRANHSCNANAGHFYDNDLKVKVLFSEREIKEGEEITISYIGFNDISLSRTPESARRKLQKTWGISCPSDCLCYDEEYYRKVKYARELDKSILHLGSTMRTAQAIVRVHELLELEERLHLSYISRARTLYDGFQVAIMKRRSVKEGMEFIGQAVEIRKDIVHPEKNEELQEMKLWSTNPSTHVNYLDLE